MLDVPAITMPADADRGVPSATVRTGGHRP